ncbi:MAG: MFS transporter [Tissierellia bacterium]|nr:MFS transporter [Tissierellia bacterium]
MDTLWTRDFKLIFSGTVISAIAGQAMQLPLMLMTFANTGSLQLSSYLMILAMLPNIVLPLLVSPFVDRAPKKYIIVILDYLMALTFFLFAFLTREGFVYSHYLALAFTTGSISAVYMIAYQAWYPLLIPKGHMQKGYAVSSTLYPTVMMIMAPVSAFMYKSVPMHYLFILVAILCALAATAELFIENQGRTPGHDMDLRAFFRDMQEAIDYLKKEKGLINIYTYMSLSSGTAMAIHLYIQVFFQTSAILGVTKLGFLTTAETLGRTLGGIVQYKVVVPAKKRFPITQIVYYSYGILDILLLFLAYPLMLLNRFIAGSLGVTSATLRETSVQAYLPPKLRAKVLAFAQMASSLSMVLFQLFGGWLGDIIGPRKSLVLLSVFLMGMVFLLITLPQRINEKVYTATDEAALKSI